MLGADFARLSRIHYTLYTIHPIHTHSFSHPSVSPSPYRPRMIPHSQKLCRTRHSLLYAQILILLPSQSYNFHYYPNKTHKAQPPQTERSVCPSKVHFQVVTKVIRTMATHTSYCGCDRPRTYNLPLQRQSSSLNSSFGQGLAVRRCMVHIRYSLPMRSVIGSSATRKLSPFLSIPDCARKQKL
jgi:hypothetical protein